jgi:hypothetical protein
MEIGVPDKKQGTIFVPIPIEVISYDAERLASRDFWFILGKKTIHSLKANHSYLKMIFYSMLELMEKPILNVLLNQVWIW